ncbi:hypothetical protein [Novosphingobium album (ex Liu et al. 2023)]|nr:hypothetical protein [Novosphingobium album (ex Liu et al. 2023)]
MRLRQRQPSRWKRNVLLLGLALAAGLLATMWSALAAKGRASAAYAARTGCVCHFISGRGVDSCKGDLGPDPIMLSANDEAHGVTARYLVFARQTATYDAAHGCVLERWDQ